MATMLAAGVDAVTITTPPQTGRELVLEAIDAGVHMVADKPFAPNAEAGRELDRAAKARGINLGVFHNRRWDADVLTLREVLDSGRLGRLWRLHSRMDLDDPNNCAYGEFGRYVSSGSDVQAQAIFAGQRSPDDLVAWGMRRRTSGGR